MALPDLSIRRPVATAMAFVGIAVLGIVSFSRLPIDLLPDVAFPTLSVWTTYEDAGPAEVERFVTEPIEEALSQVPGVRDVSSRSREGQSLVRLQFYWGTDMEFALLHVRERLDNLTDALPRSADRPAILRSDPTSDPILTLAVTGGSLQELRDLAEAVFKRRLEQLDGVALAAVTGGPEREIQVTIDPERLALHGVKIGDIRDALDRANFSAPGGSILRGRYRYSLRTLGEFQEVEELGQVVIARPAGGALVRLGDVADIREGVAERETIALYNGEAAIGLQLYKESGSNTVRVADNVRDILGELREEYPQIDIRLAASQAEFIRDAISNVVQALVVGGLLAFVVLFFFLRDPRYPVAIGLAIPISVLAAFTLCYLFNVSLNVMSLGGLALGVGMLVDNSIVVLENIFRHRAADADRPGAPGPVGSRAEATARGGAPVDDEVTLAAREEKSVGAREAASVGAREVAGAITASTLTTIAVFFPVLYVKGVAGALFSDLSLAVAFSLAASLLTALTLLPMMAARFGGGNREVTGLSMPDDVGRRAAPSATEAGEGAGRPSTAGTAVPEPSAGFGTGSGRPGSRLRMPLRALVAVARRVRRALAGLLRPVVRLVRGLLRLAARALRFVAESVRLTASEIAAVAARSAKRLTSILFGPLLRRFDRAYDAFAARYERALAWSLEHRGIVLGIAGSAVAVAVLVGATLPRSLMPDVDEGMFRVDLELPVGTPLEATGAAAERLEDVLLDLSGVDGVFTRVGRARESELASRELAGLNSASFEVRLASGGPRVRDVVSAFRSRLAETGVDPRFVSTETGRATSLGRAIAFGGADLAVRVQGDELDVLLTVAESASVRLATLPQLADVRIDFQQTQPELEIEVDRERAARYGLTVREVAEAIEAYLRGTEAERPFTEFADKVDIRLQIPIASRQELGEVLALTLDGVPIGEMVRARQGYGPVEIRREDQKRTVQVLADVRDGGIARAERAVTGSIAGIPRPSSTTIEVGGQNEEMRESFRSLVFAFGLALFLVYLIMAAQFESLVQPLVVLVSVPLAAIGAVLALWLADVTPFLAAGGLNVMSAIGLVILIGIVVNDAIIKVDFINQRRTVGASKREAILEAGRLRLRPILMTTVTTVFGLAPLALGWGPGADLRAPLAVAVIGGLISATFLTLIVVPVVYSLMVVPGEGVRAGAEATSGARRLVPEGAS